MEVYKLLSDERQRVFDAMVTGLLLRGKSLLESISIATRAAISCMN